MGQGLALPPAFQRPSGYMHLSADQNNILSATTTLLLLNTVPAEYTDGIEDRPNRRIKPGVAGYYSIQAAIWYKNLIADKSYYAEIRLSGGSLICDIGIHASFAASLSVPAMVPCQYMTEDDYVELLAWHNAGVNTIDIESLSYRTFLAVQRVR